jgi:hypothetical protein
LLLAASGIPIVSVSQGSLDFGTNVNVGNIGLSWRSLYVQLRAGLEKVKTPFVAVAEHDCLYTNEHFRFIPTDPNLFYYNRNCWLVQWKCNRPEHEFMYSYWPNRTAQSQVVAFTDSFRQAVDERLNLIDLGLNDLNKSTLLYEGKKIPAEFGVAPTIDSRRAERLYKQATSGSPAHLETLMGDHVRKWKHEIFRTKQSNLDIRHDSNFTGPKRGKKRCYELEPWGRFEDFLNGKSLGPYTVA